jgi:hypothetical protein
VALRILINCGLHDILCRLELEHEATMKSILEIMEAFVLDNLGLTNEIMRLNKEME